MYYHVYGIVGCACAEDMRKTYIFHRDTNDINHIIYYIKAYFERTHDIIIKINRRPITVCRRVCMYWVKYQSRYKFII